MERWTERLQPWVQLTSWFVVSTVLISFVAIPSFGGWARVAAIAGAVALGYVGMFVVTGIFFIAWAWVWAMSHRRVGWGGTGAPRGPGPDSDGGGGVREPRRPYPTGPPPAHEVAETREADTSP